MRRVALIVFHTPHSNPSACTLTHTLELRVDATFSSLLTQASEEIRRRVISVLTHGDSSIHGSDGAVSVVNDDGTTTKATPTGEEGGAYGASSSSTCGGNANAGTGGGAGLASVVELQEREITGLREELAEAVSRVPRGGGEGGGVSALEEALRKQVSFHAEVSHHWCRCLGYSTGAPDSGGWLATRRHGAWGEIKWVWYCYDIALSCSVAVRKVGTATTTGR